ncbi:hypothetical protein LMH34_24705 [Raoultella ornithinolytica]|uniref:Uncharacterized protein n=1 Tax=Raoultella ornithinolytica TaxID=54291 RepID=A0ABZ2DT53_RAOOR|nr:hypothetical protein [Raoultella ornithinolytica]OWY87698.1 hypothetical protein CAC00_12615 [Raoultella ornithinolytica]WPO23479.1 hypothetical protein SH582_20920 [Raoultella ornithinolytica]
MTAGIGHRGIIDIHLHTVIEQLYLQPINLISASSVIQTDIIVSGKRRAGIFKAEADVVDLTGTFK